MTDADAAGNGRFVDQNTVVFRGRGVGQTLGPFVIQSMKNQPSTYTLQNGTVSTADLFAKIDFATGIKGIGQAHVINPDNPPFEVD